MRVYLWRILTTVFSFLGTYAVRIENEALLLLAVMLMVGAAWRALSNDAE